MNIHSLTIVRWAAGILIAAAILISPPPLFAQEGVTVEEIVVFSRKRAESIQDVPLAITAFTAEEIKKANIQNLDDIAAATPGLSFFNPIGEFLPVPVIRGIAPTDIFGDPNVAIFVDGVFVTGREGLNVDLFEIESVEVIKGPQAALYGRNAFSGAIVITTKRPTETFTTDMEATVGNDGNYELAGTASGPLFTDKLLWRLSSKFDDFDGSYDDPYGGVDVGGSRIRSYRGALEFQPTENFTVIGSVFHSNDEISDAAISALTANCENVGTDDGPNSRLANYCGEIPDLGAQNDVLGIGSDTVIRKNARGLGEDRDLFRASIRMIFDTDIGTFTSTSAFNSTKQQALTDGGRNLGPDIPFVYCTEESPFIPGFCERDSVSRFTATQLQVVSPDETDEFSQEIFFSSPDDRPVRIDVGAYYFDVDLDQRETGVIARWSEDPDFNDAEGSLPPDFFAFGPFVDLGGPTLIPIGGGAFDSWFMNDNGDSDPRVAIRTNTESWAVFGAVEFDFLEKFTVRGEMRYTDEDRVQSLPTSVPEFDPDVVTPPEIVNTVNALPVSGSDNWTFLTGRVQVKYQLNDDWNFYAAVANAERSGGFDSQPIDFLFDDPNTPGNQIAVDSVPLIIIYDSEKNVTAELGAKGSLADGRVRFDLALYRTDWSDIVLPQVFESAFLEGFGQVPFEQPEGILTNAGDATIWGWEMQVNAQVTDNWSGGFGVSFTDAELDNATLESFADFPSFAPDGDVSGNTLLRQPEWQLNANLGYRRPIFGNWDFFSRADVNYQSELFGGNDNQWTIPDHTYLNLSLGMESERYTIKLWAKNLLNDDSPTGAFRIVYFNNTDDILQEMPPAASPQKFFPWQLNVSHPKLLTYGLTFRARFGETS